jgi:hypothetical protein
MNEIMVRVNLSPSAYAAITWRPSGRATGRTLRAVKRRRYFAGLLSRF